MNLKLSIIHLLQRSKHFRWHIDFANLNAKHRKHLTPYYATPPSASHCANGVSPWSPSSSHCANGVSPWSPTKRVICIMNGNFHNGGLADRLRAIVSTYQVCKECNIPFHILFTSPFSLADYLRPNRYDWHISANDVHFTPQTDIICCEITDDTPYQSRNLHRWLTKRIQSSRSSEIHIYGNPNFSFHEGTYQQLFNELFAPSIILQQSINHHLQALGKPFIVIHLRFTCALGDLTDYGSVLPPASQHHLITTAINQVRNIITQHPSPITQHPSPATLVCSDSTRFIEALTTTLPHLYTVPGHITHIDYTDTPDTDAYLKLFTEFFLMTHAAHIYRIKNHHMRLSGLPLSASILSSSPLTDISF